MKYSHFFLASVLCGNWVLEKKGKERGKKEPSTSGEGKTDSSARTPNFTVPTEPTLVGGERESSQVDLTQKTRSVSLSLGIQALVKEKGKEAVACA